MQIRPKTKRRLIFLAAATVMVGTLIGSGLAIRGRMTATKMAAARASGMDAYKAGNYTSAVSKLSYYLDRSRMLEQGENADFEALFAYGRSLQFQPTPPKGSRTQNLTQAMNLFERYVRLRADDLPAQHALLELYTNLRYWKEAQRTADDVLSRHPADVPSLKLKLYAMQHQATTPPAQLQAAAKRLTEAAPQDLWGRRQALTLRLEAGVPASQLIAEAEELRNRNPDDPWYDLLVASTYHELAQASPERTRADAAQRDAWINKARERLAAAAVRPVQQAQADRQNVDDPATKTADYVTQLVWFLDQYQMFPQSLAVLQNAVEGKDPAAAAHVPLARELAQRLWENGRYRDVVDRFSRLDPKSSSTDVRTVAWRALAMRELGEEQKQQAAGIARDLGERKADPAAVAWSEALLAHFASPPREPREKIKLFQAALAKDAGCAVLYHLIGQSYASLGELETAVQMWDAAAEKSRGWAMPRALAARVRLTQGRYQEAEKLANDALVRAPLIDAVRVLLSARWEQISRSPRLDDLAELTGQCERVLHDAPNDVEVLPLYIRLLARTKPEAALQKLTQAADAPLSIETLLVLDDVARQEKLDVGDLLVNKAREKDALGPSVALRRAQRLWQEGKVADGLALIETTRKQAKNSADPRWGVVAAAYLDAAADPGAARAWSDLADQFPKDLMVQSAALSSPTRYAQRDFWKRTIERVHALTGDEGQLWRIETCRMLLSGNPEPGGKDLSEAITRLTDLVRQSPAHAEAHRLLGLALSRDNKLPRAAEELTAAFNLRPGDVEAALELINVQRQMGNLKAARAGIDQVAQHPDLSDEAKMRIAALYEDDGRAEKAIALLASRGTMPTTGPSLADSSLSEAAKAGRMARLYRRLGKNAEAEAIYLKLLDDPNAQAADLAAGAEFLAIQGNRDKADEMLARLKQMKLRPAVMEAIEGRFAERFGTSEEAEKHFQAAIAADPKTPEAWRELAGFRLRHGKLAEAADAVDQGIKAISAGSEPGAAGNATLKALQQVIATLRAMKQPAAAAPLIDLLIRNPSDVPANGMLRILVDAQSGPPTPQSNAKLIGRLAELSDANPDFLPAIELLAQAYLDTGDAQKAATVAAKAMQAFPYDPDPARLATAAYSAAGKWANALDAATQWRQRTPADPLPAELAIASALLGQNRPQQAAQELAPYVKANPLVPRVPPAPSPVEPERAPIPPVGAPAALGETPGSQQARIRDTRLALHAQYARALVLSGRSSEAASLLRPQLASDSDVRIAWLEIAPSHKDEAAAVVWINEVTEHLASDSPAEHLALAAAWHNAGKALGSTACLDRAATLLKEMAAGPNVDREVWALFAENAQERQDQEHAIEGWRQVLKSGVTDPAISNNLAYALLTRGAKQDLAEAKMLSEQAVAASPDHSGFQDTLARIHSKLGERDQAIKTFRTALTREPNVEAMIGLADELSRNGSSQEKTEAKTWLAKARKAMEGAPPLSPPIKQQLEQLRAELDPGDGRR